MISKISDIEIGKEYYLFIVKDRKLARKAIVKAILNEQEEFKSEKTEIFISILHRGKLKSDNLFYAKEIGLGETRKEAFENYGKFDFEENSTFSTSFEKVKELNK